MDKSRDLVNVTDLAALLDQGLCRPVDCRFDLFDVTRGRKDYDSAHIPGAVYADMDRDLASEISALSGRHPLPDPGEFRRRLESWGISDDTEVVAYDYGNGSLAARLWWMLKEWLGHERVSVLDGGFAAWSAAGLALGRDGPHPKPGL
ncbi:MAG: rhodanese-like domain-containing protein, partial [Gammaproteobacteria bacterium]|nr:rhodanese-like domain-containing protein [Gammaproteobacteria bacterium]